MARTNPTYLVFDLILRERMETRTEYDGMDYGKIMCLLAIRPGRFGAAWLGKERGVQVRVFLASLALVFPLPGFSPWGMEYGGECTPYSVRAYVLFTYWS